MKLTSALLLVGLMSVSQAQAQFGRRFNNSDDKAVRVTANFQLSAPRVDGASSADLAKAMVSFSQSLNDIVYRQCDVLAAALKGGLPDRSTQRQQQFERPDGRRNAGGQRQCECDI